MVNANLSDVTGVNHGNIDEVAKDVNISIINKTITGVTKPATFSAPKDNKGSSTSSSESSSDSSSDSCSDSCFDDN